MDRWHDTPISAWHAQAYEPGHCLGLAKHRLFVWLSSPTLPGHPLVVIAREDDYAFGVLHSRPHERWSLRMGTSLEDRPRYTPTSTLETSPSCGRATRGTMR